MQNKNNLIQSLTPFYFAFTIGHFIDLDKTPKNNNIEDLIPSNEDLISTIEKIERTKCLNLL